MLASAAHVYPDFEENMMKIPSLRLSHILAAVASVAVSSGAAWGAEAISPVQTDSESTGLTIPNDATNTTHWGLGVGVSASGSPYSGYGARFQPFPLVSFDNQWVQLRGATADLKIRQWNGFSLALRGMYALGEGYDGSDAPILNGMEDRHGAFWYGPALSWHTALGTISGDYLLSGNKGERASLTYSKSFAFQSYSITPHAGFDWLSDKYVDYYYGVRPDEARPGRSAYSGGAAWNTSIGTRMDYKLTPHQNILFDVGVTHLGGGITDSPLIGKRFVPDVRIGYNYQFK
jgi:outer membrane protein